MSTLTENLSYSLPAEHYKIGTKLDPKRLLTPSLLSNMREDLRSETKSIMEALRKDGHIKGKQKWAETLAYNKQRHEEILRVALEAHSAEIAGISAFSTHVLNSVANQCYLEDGSSISGVEYRYQILFRALIDGNEVVMITRTPVAWDRNIEASLVDIAPPPQDDVDVAGFRTDPENWDPQGYHLQISPDTEFINYWYDSPPELYYERALHMRMNIGHLVLAANYRPSKPHERMQSIVLDRATMCGWRFIHNGDRMSEAGWHVARNKREAIDMARSWAAKQDKRSSGGSPRLLPSIERGEIEIKKALGIKNPWKSSSKRSPNEEPLYPVSKNEIVI